MRTTTIAGATLALLAGAAPAWASAPQHTPIGSEAPTTADQPPTVALSAWPSTGTAPLRVTLTASAADANGPVALYEWDLDGDSVTDRVSQGASIAVTWIRPGTWLPRVRTMDTAGRAADASTSVGFAAPTGPAGWLIDPAQVTVDGNAISVVVEAHPNDHRKTIEFQSADHPTGSCRTFAWVDTTFSRRGPLRRQ